ncbi:MULTISPECIES: sugar ABC transporter ATP-binding protein [unclassified Aureimonas]|uniref:sugar ABC transporter ATP-binding protein n=1 Tax=unclassified Aureimonas TaxID=2615206 RepID=UPI0006FFFC04|nr:MULTISPECIES: sugar ABC transporter ATP-binding protein [unclassified Aureimonas]KQT69006.1 ABC transporter ATP-binding protein [Aureimonas sp. Leaf460]KQT69236.1 ABC transporter ATP-binding protein [Aureimonas sp. Leaf427]
MPTLPTDPPALRLRGISKSYGPTQALDAVDLDLVGGEVVALMGANGAGKSTLVKILCGLQAADRGSIEMAGASVVLATPGQAEAAGIVAVHQSIADVGVPTLSVADNLLLDLFCSGSGPLVLTKAKTRRLARERAERIGLDVDLGAQLSDISLADRQLVAIARAVAHRPKVLLLDEPTASLSAAESERLFAAVEGLKRSGVAIVYISHKTADLRRLADRTLVLRDGRVAGSFGRPVDFDAAIRLMVGHDVHRRARARVSEGAATVLELKGVRLRRSREPFDLNVRRGEIVAVTGPVGSGKTSLAGAIFGLWPFAEGSLHLDGRPFRSKGPADSIAAGIFHAGEDRWRTSFFPASVPFASIAGTIGFPFLKRWSKAGLVPERRERAAAIEAIGAFGIKAGGPDAKLSSLSGGNQQKVVLARWHAEPSRLLLLDEPFQGVDIGARDDIIAAIRERAGERATLVFVNDYEEALEVGDRILVMEDGRLLPDGAGPSDAPAALLPSFAQLEIARALS